MSWLREWLLFGAIFAATTNSVSGAKVCSDDDYGPPFLATGTAPVVAENFTQTDGKPWYLSFGLKDQRKTPTNTQAVTAYFSVPDEYIRGTERNQTQMCAYFLNGMQNAAASADNSCQAVLDDACAKYILNFQKSFSFRNGDCPPFTSLANSGEKPCGISEPRPLINFTPTSLSSSNCSATLHSALPGIPDGYNTQSVANLQSPKKDKKTSYSKMLRLRMRQPIPALLFFGSKQDQGNVTTLGNKLLCVAPSNTTSQSPAAEMQVSMGFLFSAATAAMVGAYLF